MKTLWFILLRLSVRRARPIRVASGYSPLKRRLS